MGFIYLDNVNGERVLIEIQGSPGDKDYEFIVEESQKVLDTVLFSESDDILTQDVQSAHHFRLWFRLEN